MIDFGKILKRAWHIVWNYRVLWIFGILLAIFAGGGTSSSNLRWTMNGNNNNYNGVIPNQSSNPDIQQLNQWFQQDVSPLFTQPDQHVWTWVWIAVAVVLFIVALGLLFNLIRYPVETAVIRMVDGYEQTGEKVGFRAGWKLGWNRRAFRMWLIDLITSLPFILLALLIAGLVAAVVFSAINGSRVAIATSVIALIGCVFLFILALFVLGLALSLLRQFFIRQAALENATVGESFRQGWAMVKRNWQSAVVMWLIMFAIGLGLGIAMIIVFFLLIPLYIIALIPAVLVAGIPGLIVFGIVNIFAGWPVALLVAAVIGLPLFFTVLFSPLFLINGLVKIFESSAWTLTYREIKAVNTVAPTELPAPTE
jgi:hypothetical protein